MTEEWILFVLVSWFGTRRKNDRALPPCAIKAKRNCVACFTGVATSYTAPCGSCTAMTMLMMESLLVLLFFKLRYVTQSRCCKRVMRCFGASSVHTIIMPEAHRSVYFVITAQCNSVWCSVEYFGYKCSHCRSVLVYQCHGCLCTIPLHHCSVPVPLQCVCHCQLYKLQCGCHCQCLCIVPVWL